MRRGVAFAAAFAAVTLPGYGQITTNLTFSSVRNQTVSKTVALQLGQTATVIQSFGSYAITASLIIDGIRISAGQVHQVAPPSTGPQWLGPGLVEFVMPSTDQPDGTFANLITLRIDGQSATQAPQLPLVPTSAVVIPADAAGPVQILLESSVDLITWTSTTPGTYGTSTTNRFFRVRAIRN